MLEVNFNPFPDLKTQRLILRQLKEEDIHGIFSLRSDEKVMKFIGKPPIKTMAEALDFFNIVTQSLENNAGITWAIALKKNTGKNYRNCWFVAFDKRTLSCRNRLHGNAALLEKRNCKRSGFRSNLLWL